MQHTMYARLTYVAPPIVKKKKKSLLERGKFLAHELQISFLKIFAHAHLSEEFL